MLKLPVPYLLFVGDATHAKTAQGVLYCRPDFCLGQLRFPGGPVDLGIAEIALKDAKQHGIESLLIGAAPAGGALPESWVGTLIEALECGLDIVNGLHTRLNELPVLRERADTLGRRLIDVRRPTRQFSMSDFAHRPGKRLLTVGTDCAVGKKYTALAIEREMRSIGIEADFRATGQTGILIAGSGIAVDAVISDFVSSAASTLSPPNDPAHWDIIEGQGSLLHPAFAGVTLGLIHGSQPDAMVLCCDPTRETLGDFDLYPQPGLADCIEAYTKAASLTNPDAKVIGISLNTSALSDSHAMELINETESQFDLPCADPVRTGVTRIVQHLVASHADTESGVQNRASGR